MQQETNYFTDPNTASRLILDTAAAKKAQPELTFLVPTFRRVETLKSALNSIYSLSGLNDISYEVVVVDNSADLSPQNPTFVLLSSGDYPNLRYYINEENLGMEGNWNRGIWLARAQLVSMLHDDDLLAPCYLQAVRQILTERVDPEKLGFLKVDYSIFSDENDLQPITQPVPTLEQCLLMESVLIGIGPTWTPSCGMLFRRSAVIEAGGFRPELNPAADHAMGNRILQLGYLGYRTTQPFAYYRVGVNESMKLSTLQGFVTKDTSVRQALYESVWYGPLFRFFFEPAIYSERIEFWLRYSRTYFHQSLTVADLDVPGRYRPRPIALKILAFLRKLYRLLVFHIGGRKI